MRKSNQKDSEFRLTGVSKLCAITFRINLFKRYYNTERNKYKNLRKCVITDVHILVKYYNEYYNVTIRIL